MRISSIERRQPELTAHQYQDPVAKSQRINLDPWGNEAFGTVDPATAEQKVTHRFTTYERDKDGSDEAMHRRYTSKRNRFDQPDPSDGSYDLTNPQSLNRYAYVQNDPVNFVDPSGLLIMMVCGGGALPQ